MNEERPDLIKTESVLANGIDSSVGFEDEGNS